MGDRTHVTLTVLTAQAARAKALCRRHCGDWEEEHEQGGFTYLCFDEVNYATLDAEQPLQAMGIAYDKEWEAGGDYGAGHEYCRFTAAGDCRVFDVYDEAINPDLGVLLAAIDHPAALRALILIHRDAITPLPWDRQVEYGRLYRTRNWAQPASTLAGTGSLARGTWKAD